MQTRLYRIYPKVLTQGPCIDGIDLLKLTAMNIIGGIAQGWRDAAVILAKLRDSDAARWVIFTTAFAIYVAIGAGWGMPK